VVTEKPSSKKPGPTLDTKFGPRDITEKASPPHKNLFGQSENCVGRQGEKGGSIKLPKPSSPTSTLKKKKGGTPSGLTEDEKIYPWDQ